jgi:DNA-binding NtrC family response regulator
MKASLLPENPVLIVDDEQTIITSLDVMLRSSGINNLIGCPDSREVMGLVREREPEVILLDLSMPHLPGEKLLAELRDGYPHIPVIIVTGTDEVKAAVECMKAGGFDYMVKPVEESRLVSGVKRAIEIRRLQQDFRQLKEKLLTATLVNPEAFAHIATQNRAMRSIFLIIESIAKTNEPVLITGETGVGKKLVAQAVHYASGREGPFIDINTAGLDDTVFADTLFGHRKGAFTSALDSRGGLIQQASGGTIILDEIGNLSASSQIKLLRLLDTSEYYPLGADLPRRTDARFVVATNRELGKLIEEEKFRKDLYYRLSTHELRIPPLRERKEDLPLLLAHYLAAAAEELGKNPPMVPPELLALLETYHFPGNVRELRAMIYDAVSKHSSGTLSLGPFREVIGRGSASAQPRRPEAQLLFPEKLPTIREATELLVKEALQRAKGNQSIAAVLLGISHQALNKRLQPKR